MSVIIAVETADVCNFISSNLYFSSFVNILICLDTGRAEFFSDIQLGPYIQLFLFDTSYSGKYFLNGRSETFSFPGTLKDIFFLVNSLISLIGFSTNYLYCLFSLWIDFKVINESDK